jgi:type VI secretion system secreted protein VgrG
MVGFLNGDPEEPMVVGRMYTNLQRPPYPLPAKKNINGFKSQESIGGTGKNELYFDDSKGEMLMFRHAGKNEKTETVGSRDEWIGESRSARIDKNRSSSIGGNDKKTVTGNEDEAIEGNQTHSVKGNKVGNVIGDLLSYVKKGRILDTLGSMVSNALTHSFDSRLMTTIKVGKSSIVISPESIVIETPQLLLNPGKEIAEKAALGLDTSPTPSPSSMPSTEELPS